MISWMAELFNDLFALLIYFHVLPPHDVQNHIIVFVLKFAIIFKRT